MPKIKSSVLNRRRKNFLKAIFDTHAFFEVSREANNKLQDLVQKYAYRKNASNHRANIQIIDTSTRINLGRFVTTHLASTQFYVANQPSDISEKIITRRIQYLTDYIKIIFRDNYPTENQADDEFWQFVADGLREVVTEQLNKTHLINFYKRRILSYCYTEQYSPAIYVKKLLQNLTTDFQNMLIADEVSIAIQNSTRLLDQLHKELNSTYYANTQRTWNTFGISLTLLVTAAAIPFSYLTIFIVLSIGIIFNYIYAGNSRSLTAKGQHDQIQLVKQIPNIDIILALDEEFNNSKSRLKYDSRIPAEFKYALYLEKHGDPFYRFQATRIEYESAPKPRNNNVENQPSEYLDYIFSTKEAAPYTINKEKNKEKKPRSRQDNFQEVVKPSTSKIPIKWSICDPHPKYPQALITGNNKNNPTSMICIAFPDNPTQDSKILEKIQAGEFGFAAKRKESGFKYYSNLNQYTFKYGNLRWDCQPTKNKISIKNNLGETKVVPEYQCVNYRHK